MAYIQFDPDDLFPPDRFIRIRDVPVFDAHESPGHGGKPKRVTKDDLQQLARNCNHKFDSVGAATPLSLGHTIDDAPESSQPPLIGWAVKFSVKPLLNTGRDALFCDWYVKRKFADAIEEYPHRSVEWWKSRNDLNPIALLKTAPERDLPIIKYSQTPDPNEDCYRYTFTPPTVPNESSMEDKTKDDAVSEAKVGEMSSVKEIAAKVDALTEMMTKILPVVESFGQLMSEMDKDGDGNPDDSESDLLAPAEGDEDGDDADDEEPKNDDDGKDAKKDKDADSKKDDEEPEKYGEGCYAGPGNSYTPSEKAKMSRSDEEKVKFQKEVTDKAMEMAKKYVDEKTAAISTKYNEISRKYSRSQAERAVAELADKNGQHRIDFGDAAEVEKETKFLADLLIEDGSGNSFKQRYEEIAKKFRRYPDETPDSAGAEKAIKHSRTEAPKNAINSEAEFDEFQKLLTQGLVKTVEDFAAKKTAK